MRSPLRLGIIHLRERFDTYVNYWEWEFTRNYPNVKPVVMMRKLSPLSYLPSDESADVYVHFDDSFNYEYPADWRPLIYYCEDLHVQDGVDRVAFVQRADYVFCHQLNAAEHFRRLFPGKPIEWLPHAADLQVHAPCEELDRTIPVCFVGTINPNPTFAERNHYWRVLTDHFPQAQHFEHVYFNQLAEIYGRSMVVWNHPVGDDVNMRAFEATAAGALLLTKSIGNGFEELFSRNNYVSYDDEGEMIERLTWCLDPSNRETVCYKATRAHRQTHEAHGYNHRVERFMCVARQLADGRPVTAVLGGVAGPETVASTEESLCQGAA